MSELKSKRDKAPFKLCSCKQKNLTADDHVQCIFCLPLSHLAIDPQKTECQICQTFATDSLLIRFFRCVLFDQKGAVYKYKEARSLLSILEQEGKPFSPLDYAPFSQAPGPIIECTDPPKSKTKTAKTRKNVTKLLRQGHNPAIKTTSTKKVHSARITGKSTQNSEPVEGHLRIINSEKTVRNDQKEKVSIETNRSSLVEDYIDHGAIDLSTLDHRPKGLVSKEGKHYSSDIEGDTALMKQVYIDRRPSTGRPSTYRPVDHVVSDPLLLSTQHGVQPVSVAGASPVAREYEDVLAKAREMVQQMGVTPHVAINVQECLIKGKALINPAFYKIVKKNKKNFKS